MGLDLTPRNPPARYGLAPIPVPVVVALLYCGVMSLVILWLQNVWPRTTGVSLLSTAAWIDAGGAEAFRRLYRTVHLLMLAYLWFSARGGIGGRNVAIRWSLVNVALLVLAVHRALDAALSALPRIVVSPWRPIGF